MFMDRKRRGMFGGVVMPGTPGIGDGIEERQQVEMGDPAPGLGMRGAPLPQQPTGFERPTGLRRAAGLFADFAAGLRGKEGQYAAMLEKRREAAAELASEQRKRALGLEDYEAKKVIDQRYPANNDTIADFNWYKNLSPEDQAIYHRMKPQYRVGPDGLMYPVQVAPPVTAPAGVTFTPLDNGGPASSAPGNFREAFAEWN